MRLLAIDGNSILNRAFYGIKLLSNKKGVFTNAVTGFMNIYLKAVEDEKPDAVAVAFDLKAPTFRHKKVLSYKANRKGMPPELAQQLPFIKDILSALGVMVVEKEGFEADDILGTLSKICSDSQNSCVILTGDRDSLQLINDNVTVRLATNKEQVIYSPDKFREVYGLEPLQLIDLKALMGDSSDNITGVPGIGEKTALSLIKEHQSIEKLYENIENAELTNSVRTKLISGKDSAFESKWLAAIALDVPIENDVSYYVPKNPDAKKATEILSELEMFALLKKLNLSAAEDIKPAVSDESQAEITVEEMISQSIKNADDELYFVIKRSHLKVFDGVKIYFTEDISLILDFLKSENKKLTFSAKSVYHFAFENQIEIKNLAFDAEIAAYLLNPSSSEYTIKRLCDEYRISYPTDLNENADVFALKAVCDKFKDELIKTGTATLFYEIEQPLTEVLASMEYNGVLVDRSGVSGFGDKLKTDLKGLEEQIYFMSGKEFNISSPKQLGDILFEELGLPSKKKTKTGYSTNADVLEQLKGKHPIIELILQYRQLSKLNSTYVEGLLKSVGDDSRIHSNFKQTETRTGRISSTEPNMQNIPVRTDLGRNMRKFFVAKDGYILLDADYSQIELRILASVCDDENMKNAFLSGMDIHTATASQVFNMPPEMVTSSMRRAAKAVNFGIIYGIGAFSLSKDIDVSVAEADRYIKSYLANYPNVAKYMDKTVTDAIESGYVSTMFGRRRYIPELSSSNKMLQAFGKRAAMNAPIQGSAADIIKIAMIKVYYKLKEEKLDARLILQVHDELIVEASEECAERAAVILNDEMEHAAELSVPLIADVNKGRSWYDAKG